MTISEVKEERRSDSHVAIERLIEHRNEMLALYSELAARRPFKKCQEAAELTQKFCQALIDYTADAHFRLYRYIENGTERRQAVRDAAKQVYPNIAAITQDILDFNDKYATEEDCREFDGLELDLSRLGERLAERIELEDQLVSAMTRKKV